MKLRIYPFALSLLLSLALLACSGEEEGEKTHEVVIPARNSEGGLSRPPIYRARLPYGWIYKEPPLGESVIDTKKPIYTIIIDSEDEEDDIVITIHNFPLESLDARVPQEAQIERWKRQLGEKVKHLSLKEQAFGGFSGVKFEGEGVIDGKPTEVIAWSMHLAPEHFYALSQEHEGLTKEEARQMRSDYTIKVVGPPDPVRKNREAIDAFARSFRLYKPLPSKR